MRISEPSSSLPSQNAFNSPMIQESLSDLRDASTEVYIESQYTNTDNYMNLPYGMHGDCSNKGTVSFIDNAPTLSERTEGTGSYVLVPDHEEGLLSDDSNRPTELLDSFVPLFPHENSADWNFGAEFAVDRDTIEEDTSNFVLVNNQDFLLFPTYSPEPQPGDNTCQEALFISCQEDTRYQKYIEHNVVEDPWNPVAHRVSAYDPGFVAFVPSPVPSLEQESIDPIGRRTEVAPRSHRDISNSVLRNTRPAESSTKGKHQLGWQHVMIAKNGSQYMTQHPDDECRSLHSGVRRGKLSTETAEKARRIRKLGACWSCWISKVPCSEGNICDRCKKLSPATPQHCWRFGFRDFEELFFPEYFHAHLRKRNIESLIREHISGFMDINLKVSVSAGCCFEPMTLDVNVFRPTDWELLGQFHLSANTSQILQRYSAPVGFLGLETRGLMKRCKKHVQAMVKNPHYAGQTTAGDRTHIPLQILTIAATYCESKTDVSLVQNAMTLHAMHYFMSSLITFTEESANIVGKHMEQYGKVPGLHLTSRLLSRQIKYAMHNQQRMMTKDCLDGLEKSMKTRSKDSWGISFCTILVLCLCIEQLQIAADVFVVCDIQKDGSTSKISRAESHAACSALDEKPFQRCMQLFHSIYRTHKESNGGAREAGFNPFKVLDSGNVCTDLDTTTNEMIRSVYSLMRHSYAEILEHSERPLMINLEDNMNPHSIKTNNNGRLAAKFLRSFFEKIEA